MAGQTHTHTWVPLRDYLVEGVRPPKTTPTRTITGLPSTWISAWDYWVEGVRKPRHVDEKNTIVTLKPPSPKKPVPPEVWLTMEDVVADIQAIFSVSIVPSRVEERHVADQQELERGEIVEEEWQYRSARLDEIQEEHFVRIEEIIQWYIDNYFREWESDAAGQVAH